VPNDNVDELTKQLDAALADARNLSILVEGVPQLLWRSSNMGHWTWSNRQWQAFTGQTLAQSVDRGWLDAVHPDDKGRTLEAWEGAVPHGELDTDFRVRRASDGTYIWHRTRSSPVRNAYGQIMEWLGSTTDVDELKCLQDRQSRLLDDLACHARQLEAEIAERRRVEDQLIYEAQHDMLTRLKNRGFLLARLRDTLGRGQGRCSVLMLDLDRFKLVNDSMGHATGDLLLREVADRLTGVIRAVDILARFGGDEFAVLIADDGGASAAIAIASRIIEVVQQPFSLDGQDVFSSCSVGIVHVSSNYASPEAVLRDADIAMYHAKRHGPGDFAVFTEAMHEAAVEALHLRTDLRSALPSGELLVHYQPVCFADTGRIAGLEALVRWSHTQRGLVPPSTFVPIAEDAGLIGEIGQWVLRTACSQLREWQRAFPTAELTINVNSSAVELKRAGFVEGVRDILAETGISPEALQIEVTESVFLSAAERVDLVIRDLRRLGVRVALDDFGTGYSSLAYLERYQIDTIKIDQIFVRGLARRPRSLAVVETVLRMGKALGLTVVAEGVEEEEQLRALQEAGCSFVQGYLLGRPMEASAVTDFLAGQHQASRV